MSGILSAIASNYNVVLPVTYATWNPTDKGTRAVLSNGDLTLQPSNGGWAGVRSTISKSSGKWYWEFVPNGAATGGISIGTGNNTATLEDYLGIDSGGWGLYGGGNQKIHSGSASAYGTGNTNPGDVVGILLNMDAGEISVRVNNTDFGVMYTGLTGNIFAIVNGLNNVGTSNGGTANFGATPFAYSVPSGYNAGLYA